MSDASRDLVNALLEDVRAIRNDLGFIKEQVVKTNGRVTRAEGDIERLRVDADSYSEDLSDLRGTVSSLERGDKASAEEKNRSRKTWDVIIETSIKIGIPALVGASAAIVAGLLN